MRNADVQRGASNGGSLYEQIQRFYKEVENYSANGVMPKEMMDIHSISKDHIIAKRAFDQCEIIVMINRSSKMTKIPIPQKYAKAQVIFQKGRIDGNSFQANAMLILKM